MIGVYLQFSSPRKTSMCDPLIFCEFPYIYRHSHNFAKVQDKTEISEFLSKTGGFFQFRTYFPEFQDFLRISPKYMGFRTNFQIFKVKLQFLNFGIKHGFLLKKNLRFESSSWISKFSRFFLGFWTISQSFGVKLQVLIFLQGSPHYNSSKTKKKSQNSKFMGFTWFFFIQDEWHKLSSYEGIFINML